ncbi:MAG: methyltransferase domain-containing protein [Bacteroidales bacterium]|nr:methyltransferase domain-containing protein [Bacteroidales bacterium]
MNISVENFFKLFLKELENNKNLWGYYKFLASRNKAVYNFRTKYFLQRLNYIYENVEKSDSYIWDCGCGYGSVAIFLALNGHKVYGNTLEHYFELINQRLKYWNNFGDLKNLSLNYEDIFDLNFKQQFNYVIAQDTLHHLEPNDKALKIIHDSLISKGKLISTEVNGNSIIQQLQYFLRRGNKKIIELYDEKLDKTFLLGNENIRSLRTWTKLMKNEGLIIDHDSVQFIRLYFPIFYRFFSSDRIIKNEQFLCRKISFLKEYFFFGLNFTAVKE